MKKDDNRQNTHPNAESWLTAAIDGLRPYFEKLGHPLPEKIRAAIGFTSMGKRGRIPGECWHSSRSADKHYKIYIRTDKDDPVEILGILVKELVHTLLPPEAKHGRAFREIALRIGLEGPMRQARPTAILAERLNALAVSLGPLPHGRLDFATASDVPKKQRARLLKAECEAKGCGYTVRLAAKWAKVGLPLCPANPKHGVLRCDIPDDELENDE